jgi:hypothetical protein
MRTSLVNGQDEAADELREALKEIEALEGQFDPVGITGAGSSRVPKGCRRGSSAWTSALTGP